jgi:hypothetical protein
MGLLYLVCLLKNVRVFVTEISPVALLSFPVVMVDVRWLKNTKLVFLLIKRTPVKFIKE